MVTVVDTMAVTGTWSTPQILITTNPPNVTVPDVFDRLGTLAQSETRSMTGVTWLLPVGALRAT